MNKKVRNVIIILIILAIIASITIGINFANKKDILTQSKTQIDKIEAMNDEPTLFTSSNSEEKYEITFSPEERPYDVWFNTYDRIEAGEDHYLAIDVGNRLWGWGTRTQGLGSHIDNAKPYVPKVLMTNISHIAAGVRCSFAIDKDGNLYGWGYNKYGQIGTGSIVDVDEPTLICSGTKFVDVKTGYYCTYAIDEDGNLWSWGRNCYGQLADGTTNDRATPRIVIESSDINISEIINDSGNISKDSMTNGATYILDTRGYLYGWGKNVNGSLGVSGTEIVKTPTPIMSTQKFEEIYKAGSNVYGITPINTVVDVVANKEVLSESVTYLSVSSTHCLALTGSGKAYSWRK